MDWKEKLQEGLDALKGRKKEEDPAEVMKKCLDEMKAHLAQIPAKIKAREGSLNTAQRAVDDAEELLDRYKSYIESADNEKDKARYEKAALQQEEKIQGLSVKFEEAKAALAAVLTSKTGLEAEYQSLEEKRNAFISGGYTTGSAIKEQEAVPQETTQTVPTGDDGAESSGFADTPEEPASIKLEFEPSEPTFVASEELKSEQAEVTAADLSSDQHTINE